MKTQALKVRKTQVVKKIFRGKMQVTTIKGKLYLMGISALSALVVVGGLSIVALQSNGESYEVTMEMNKIKQLKQEVGILNTQYFYTKDPNTLDQMVQSTSQGVEELAVLKQTGSGALQQQVEAIQQALGEQKGYLEQIGTLTAQRGMQPTDEGSIYKQYMDNEGTLDSALQTSQQVSGWVDYPMDTTDKHGRQEVVVDGTTYLKVQYKVPVKDTGRRNTLIIRTGASAIDYTGNIFVVSPGLIKGEQHTPIDMQQQKEAIETTSYGSALTGVSLTTFDEQDAIQMQIGMQAANASWEEANTKLLIEGMQVEGYDFISYDMYIEKVGQAESVLAGIALDHKSAYGTRNAEMSATMDDYTRVVINGDEAGVVALGEEMLQQVDEIIQMVKAYHGPDEDLSSMLTGLEAKKALLQELQGVDIELARAYAGYSQISTQLDEQIQHIYQSIEDDMYVQKTLVITTVALLLVGCVGIISLLLSNIIKRFNTNSIHFKKALEGMSAGQLRIEEEHKTNDEFGVLFEMLQGFGKRISEVLSSATQLSQEVEAQNLEMAGIVQQATQDMNQITKNFQEINASVNKQYANTEEAMAELNEILIIGETSETEINNTQDVTKAALKEAEEGSAQIGVLGDKMQAIHNNVGDVAEEMKLLVQDAVHINDVLKAIENLSAETKMLSLNASIEASRAGESGRGFLVVAQQVKRLSEDTSKQTEKIRSTIQGIERRIAQVNARNQNVVVSVDQTREVLDVFADNTTAMCESNQVSVGCVDKLKHQIDEQMRGTHAIMSAVEEVSNEAGAINEKSGVTTDMTQRVAEDLTASLENMTSILEKSKQLSKDMGYFKF